MKYLDRLHPTALTIFLFHGVVLEHNYSVRNYSRKHILAQEFKQIIKSLSIHGTPLSVDQVVEYSLKGMPYPKNSFMISFDDGFENNFSIAADILREFHVPAVFYISTDFIENNSMSWVDRMEYVLERSLSSEICLPWEQTSRKLSSKNEKIALLDEARRYIKSESSFDLDSFLVSFAKDCKEELVTSSNDSLDLKMSWEQVRILSKDPLFTIGGHSHRHVILSFLSKEEMEEQIGTSLFLLNRELKIPIRHYSYPEGLANCYSKDVINVLKFRGIVCSPSAEDGINPPGSDLFDLKRVMVN